MRSERYSRGANGRWGSAKAYPTAEDTYLVALSTLKLRPVPECSSRIPISHKATFVNHTGSSHRGLAVEFVKKRLHASSSGHASLYHLHEAASHWSGIGCMTPLVGYGLVCGSIDINLMFESPRCQLHRPKSVPVTNP